MTFSGRSKSAALCKVPFGHSKWLGVSQSAVMKTALEGWVCALTAAMKCTPPVRTGTDRTDYCYYLLSASRVGIIIITIIVITIIIIIFTSSYHLLQTLQQIASFYVLTQ